MQKHQGRYIEFKARKYVGTAIAEEIIAKQTISIVLSTGRIWKPARTLFDRAGITWADNLPKDEILNYKNKGE
jgi:hypothetical protein